MTETERPLTRVQYAEPTREELVRELWPDKALYASVLLFFTGFLGVLTGLVQLSVGLRYGANVPAFVSEYPAWATLGLSVASSAAAGMALARRSTAWAAAGCGLGLLSLGFLGVNALLSLIAGAFVLRSWREGETTNPATRVLTADMWPDKALAASLLLLIVGVLTVVWGAAMLFDAVTYEGYFGGASLFGALALAFGTLACFAARRVSLQESPFFGVLAALLAASTLALWVVGPVLAVAAATLVLLGLRESEFEAPVV